MAAAYGVLVLVFQHGCGQGLLGVSSADGIEAVVPLLLFVILFGLSMDYHVFILSRIRETFDRGATMDDVVAHGIKSTASVATSAAIVMVAVFAVFGTLSAPFFKQFGVGLAAAILIDATIVRAVLLPATMKLLGAWNWYLPGWLQWLPRLEPYEPEPSLSVFAHVDERTRADPGLPVCEMGGTGLRTGDPQGCRAAKCWPCRSARRRAGPPRASLRRPPRRSGRGVQDGGREVEGREARPSPPFLCPSRP